MVERALALLAALAAPLLGVLLRSSRRTRLRHRIDEYLALAEQVAAHEPETADRLRALAREAIDELIRRDRRWLHQRFDPAAAFAAVLGVLPAVAIFVWALGWDSGWKWPVLALAAIWTALWGGVGISQVRTEHQDEPDAPQPSASDAPSV
jgi:hypothetical protein